MIKIIFSDMDGTLLDSKSQLPKQFDKMIAKLKARNIIFCPASGRQYFSLRRSFDKYKDEFMFVAENGTVVMYKGKEIYSNPMSNDVALNILKTAEEFPKILPVYCGKKKSYLLKSFSNQKYIDELDKYFSEHEFVESFDEIDDVPIKMSFFDWNAQLSQTIYPKIKEKFSKTMQVVLASEFWLDVMVSDGNKGTAVKEIQKQFNIKPEECAAFGDYFNDIQMLKAVKYSFAMENAHSEVKQIAKYETLSNDDDGVLVGIEKLMNEGLI